MSLERIIARALHAVPGVECDHIDSKEPTCSEDARYVAAAVRDWLTADEQVERAARAVNEPEPGDREDCWLGLSSIGQRTYIADARAALTALTEGGDHPRFTAFKNKRLQSPAVTAAYEEAKARRDEGSEA